MTKAAPHGSPNGQGTGTMRIDDNTVTLSWAEYEALIDARDHATALRRVADGSLETLTEAAMDDYLAAPTPLAFWRRHREVTQAGLAAAVGVSQPYLAQIETGKRVGDVGLYARLARALRVTMEELAVEA